MTGKRPGLAWLFFSFRGRIARQSFTLAISLQLVLLFLVVYWAVAAGNDAGRQAFAGFAFMALSLFNLWSSFALTVKRLNDANLPTLLCGLLLIPGAGLILIIILMVTPGDPQANRHGPPPFGT